MTCQTVDKVDVSNTYIVLRIIYFFYFSNLLLKIAFKIKKVPNKLGRLRELP